MTVNKDCACKMIAPLCAFILIAALYQGCDAAPVIKSSYTKNGCECVPKWTYFNGTDSDALQLNFTGCANPDKDERGNWCPVDPQKCPKWHGKIENGRTDNEDKRVLYYDYCLAKNEAPRNPAQDLSQAKCECLPNWQWKFSNTTSANFTGCANPDNDPQGAWCPVDLKKCPGAYGNFTWQGTNYTYDYCGQVRKYTRNGCLCQGTWRSWYHKSKVQNGGTCVYSSTYNFRYCVVSLATCKTPNVWTEIDEWRSEDLCMWDGPKAPSPATPGSLTTQSGCKCEKTWSYVDKAGMWPKWSTNEGCQNPDYDPRGLWCMVDGRDCPSYYDNFTSIVPNTNEQRFTLYFDYCADVSVRTQAGCLCKSSWGPDGKYFGQCSNPDKKALSWCEIIPGTCKKGQSPVGGSAAAPWDFCGKAIPSPPPPSPPPPSPPTAVRQAAGAQSTQSAQSAANTTVVVADPPKKEGTSDSTRLVRILAPIASVLAALTTMAYTLYKCHKKHRFFKNHQVMKLAAAISQNTAVSNTNNNKDQPGTPKPAVHVQQEYV